MDYMKKIYRPMQTRRITHHKCRINLSIDESKAQQIVHFIPWRVERLSRLFSRCLQHDPKERSTRELKKEIQVNSGGSCELYEALKNFLVNRPLIFLMTMFPKYGKSRFEIEIVFPDYDGTYQEREQKGAIVPKNRWIDNLTLSDLMEQHFTTTRKWSCTCDAAVVTHVPLSHPWEDHYTPKSKFTDSEPDYDLPSSTLHERAHPSRSNKQHADHGATQPKYGMGRPAPESVEQDRKIKPFDKKPTTFMFHATYNDQIYNIPATRNQAGEKLDPTRENPCPSCKH